MSATLRTPNYNLPYFSENDDTDWAAYNSAVVQLDTDLKEVEVAGGNNNSAIQAMQKSIQTLTEAVQTTQEDVVKNTNAIQGVNTNINLINQVDVEQNQKISSNTTTANSALTTANNAYTEATNAADKASNALAKYAIPTYGKLSTWGGESLPSGSNTPELKNIFASTQTIIDLDTQGLPNQKTIIITKIMFSFQIENFTGYSGKFGYRINTLGLLRIPTIQNMVGSVTPTYNNVTMPPSNNGTVPGIMMNITSENQIEMLLYNLPQVNSSNVYPSVSVEITISSGQDN